MTAADVQAAEGTITRLMFDYTRAIDEGRLEDFAGYFERGIWAVEGRRTCHGDAEVLEYLRQMVILYDGVPLTRHVVSNISIDVSADLHSATASSYLVVHQAAPGEVPEIIVQGEYRDRFASDDGVAWHFVERSLKVDGRGHVERHYRGPVSAPTQN